MGLPKILIEFKTLAETLIARSERGIVAVIVKDNSNTTKTAVYTKESEIVKSHYTETNLAYLSLVFMGGPSKVIVERVQTAEDISDALERLKNKRWYYLTVPGLSDGETDTVVEYIKEQRTQYHKTFKAVLPSAAADCEGIINFATDNIKIGAKTYTTAEFCCRIAGILAGLPLNRSATYYTLSEVESITESETPDDDVDNGKLILINDGTKIKFARGVNSLTTTTEDKGEDFKKIKIIEPVYETDSYEAKIKIEREDVDFVMQMAKDSKMTGLTGEWSMKVKKVFSRGAQLLSEKIKKGIDVRIQIISKIDDPDAYGSERLVIENAWFNELTLQKFENAKMIDEEYSGGFTDYYFPDLVKVR